ncbi:MAG: NAD(P)H-dependent oxidoreductase [Boseongicola sp. SB0677_bin_26]|nr:NAD(P)H-dependent oxidoreductase [Boseongicola sp. SB0665_bin_10]MYG27123.1 NAD(P)H-dependent oxidoreductase [Boseongicola sp. SB0677_bin_26]
MSTLLLICGALRQGSFNRKLLVAAGQHWSGATVMADLDMPLYNGDVEVAEGIPEAATRIKRQIEAADAVAIATPEYNQSISGVLKNALDWVSRGEGNPWRDKPVAIMSATAGRAGGARAQYALRLALNTFQPRLLTGPEVMVAHAQKEFDPEGRLIGEGYQRALEALVGKLASEAVR